VITCGGQNVAVPDSVERQCCHGRSDGATPLLVRDWLKGGMPPVRQSLGSLSAPERRGVAQILAVVQFHWMLFGGERNQMLTRFGNSLSKWFSETVQFLSCASDEKAIPVEGLARSRSVDSDGDGPPSATSAASLGRTNGGPRQGTTKRHYQITSARWLYGSRASRT
jgi:Domain of unknown function (DUF4389)